ncbi:hypothetical protein [Bacillus salipaludis]|uniref:Uncharacterized protein n=1 Tax=Bacillus salipaludis TaxID=2547811 RepID=A0AA90TTR1_9BACI|nr:hypothetical protein [Bacillus salipaludis]MDQ6598094.1 hypothetical protein [Bacillus salipaludis]
MLQQFVLEYIRTLRVIHTLSTGSVNRIILVDKDGLYVETEASKAKFLAGEKKYPYDLIPESYLLEVWQLLSELRTIHAGDLKTSKGCSSFLLALFSKLPFVKVTSKDGRSAIGLNEYYVSELPESNIPNVLDFLEEVAQGKFHPQMLTRQIEDKNLQRLKSSQRQGLRLLGLIDNSFKVNRVFIDQYRQSDEKKNLLRNQMMKLPYFSMVQTLLSAPIPLNMIDKTKAIRDLGQLVVRNPIGGNLMKESVGEKLSRNTLSWLQYVNTYYEEDKSKSISMEKGVMEMKMLNKDRPGICYSNISLIKKALLQNSENILPYPEILLYVKKNWMDLNSTFDDIKEIVELALYAPKSYFYEVEDGLWGIKDKIDDRLNHIYQYMNPRKISLKISDMKYRLKVYESDDILRQMLLSDIRFSQIENTPYWVLSEWVIINNLVYECIFNSELLVIDKETVLDRVIKLNKLDKDKVIFLPQFDDRFAVNGNRIEIKRVMETNTNPNKQKLEIPVEISEEVGRLSYRIINFIKESKKEVTTSQIINQVFYVTQNEPSFPIYMESIKELLEVVPEIKQAGEHTWLFKEEVSNFHIENNENVYYAVRNSLPTIENVKELRTVRNPQTDQLKKESGNHNETSTDARTYAYHTVSYFDRVKGYFIIPKALREVSVLFRQSNYGKVMVQHDDFRYEWFWDMKENKYFFFGDGVMDFFADYLIEPGHKLRFEVDKQIMFLIRVHNVGFDERYASEQQRYLDIGRLVEESKTVNKSIFSLMCETLAIHPSGIHWSVLQDKISEKRSTTKNTITNLLSRNECFEQVEGKKGYWRLNISKLTRYYVDEENQEMIEPVESGIELRANEKGSNESLKVEPKEEQFECNDQDKAVEQVTRNELTELQPPDTETLIQQIESILLEITQKEVEFKESISKSVLEEFDKGDIAAVDELYNRLESSIIFFNRVGEVVNQQERKS